MWQVIARSVLLCGLVACGDPAAHVQLVPIDLGTACGKPPVAMVTAVRVIAYTSTGELRRTDASIGDFPADTEQLGVEVVGGVGGQVLATGKTAPLAYGDLADKTAIPIAMIPPDGFCPVHAMTEARAHPLVARAGAGVLVVGGSPDASAEYYDPETATFAPVALPGVLRDDPTSLDGAALATLGDGRVVLSGGQALTVFDPDTQKFSEPSLVAKRNGHAAIGIDTSHVLVTGGCLAAGATCDAMATPLHSSLEYELDANGAIVGDGIAKAALPSTSVRYGAQLFDLGAVGEDKHRFALAGSTADPDTIDVIPFDARDDSGTTENIAGAHAQPAALDGGALLTAFDLDGSTPTGGASIIGTDNIAVPIALAPKLDGARVIALEDGSVLAIGGDAAVARYVPTTNSWAPHAPAGDAPGVLAGVSLVRLADGSVLALGGTDGGPPTANAWLYRPSLIGPTSGNVVAFADGSGAILTTPAPSTATRAANRLTLTSGDDSFTAAALVGGPKLASGSMDVSLDMVTGGVYLVAQHTGPGRALVARFVPGEPARIERHDGTSTTPLCSGKVIDVTDLMQPLHFVVGSDGATASFGTSDAPTVAVSCDLAGDPIAPERGAWGVASAQGSLVVVAVTVARRA
jgi:hypothetical protein